MPQHHQMMPRATPILLLLAYCYLPLPAAADSPPPYSESPVFFEMHPNDYGDPENRELLPQGRVSLSPLGVEDVGDFDWKNHSRSDRSWWNRIENFFYLCPLLASGEESQRRVVNEWFEGWYARHPSGSIPNKGAWDGMTAGQRALVLTWILKLETIDPLGEPALRDNLVDAIRRHRIHLLPEKRFEKNSNHGMWQALGLLETTRVEPIDSVATIALERLVFLTRRSVSSAGVHKEHSPGYHFTFLKWLSGYVPYLKSIYPEDRPEVAELRAAFDNMYRSAHYLYDHDGRVPPIGDTAETQVPTLPPLPNDNPLLFDRQAGFAIFKDPDGSRHTRYVVFNIQNKQHKPQLPFHYHDDALAVYYSDDGETIFDDAGRLTYRNTIERKYVRTPAGHSTVVTSHPDRPITGKSRHPVLADAASVATDGDTHNLSASVFEKTATRTLSITADGGLTVEDRFEVPKLDIQLAVLWMIGRDVAEVEQVDTGRWRLVTARGRAFELQVTTGENMPPSRMQLVEGREKPLLGWRADGFEVFVPAKTIVVYVPMGVPSSLTTTVRPAQ
jgi:hypothetical protein